jgi:hypothetical protein
MSGDFFKDKPVWCFGGVDIAAIAIVVFALFLGVSSVWNDAPIVDEIPHIGAGYSYIATGDARLNPEHPPMAKDFAGISLKVAGIKDEAAFNSRFWNQDLNGQWEFGRSLIFNSGNDAIRLVRFAKLPLFIFFIFCAIIIFAWTRKIYGYLAALIATFLFSFSPTVMAHSRFVTTDIPALFGILLATYFFVHYLEKPSMKTMWLAGLVFGIAQLTKFSVFLLVPFFLGLAVIYACINFHKLKIRNSLFVILNTVFIIAIGYIFVVWPVYYLHVQNYPIELQHEQTDTLLSSYGRRSVADTVVYLSGVPVVRGLAHYGLGLLMVTQRAVGGNTTYFLGEVSKDSWPHYFPLVYFLKEPLPFWILVFIITIFGIIKIKKPGKISLWTKHCTEWTRNHFAELAMMLWIALYWYSSIKANLNIGVRHLIPAYGFTYILIAGALVNVCLRIKSKKILTTFYIMLAALFGWYLCENLSIYPYYLSYFNQTAQIRPSWAPPGKAYIPGGHNYVVDSNLDWGQDLKRLAEWVEVNQIRRINFDYFGWADQSYYLGNNFNWIWAGRYNSTEAFLAENPNGGYIAVSASFYMGSRGNPQTSYSWLDSYQPVAIIGNSIFIWYIPPR